MKGQKSIPLEIRRLGSADRPAALEVINEAARWYREFLAPEHYHEPEMTAGEWDAEARRMTWYGAFEAVERLVGVMALQRVGDVALLRHAYILPDYQRRGAGSKLLARLEGELAPGTRIVVGTYRENTKARGALEKAGYHSSADPETVLRAYYDIAEDRLRASVTYEKTLAPTPTDSGRGSSGSTL